MKRTILLALCVFTFYTNAQVLKSAEGTVSFFSEAPIENIDATSTHLVSAINSSTNEIVFSVSIRSLHFKNKKMEEDFNDDFMDTDKYPVADYKGKINEKIEWAKEGSYKITSTGVLTIHGVGKERTDEAEVTIKNGKITMKSEFQVGVADHKIRIPKLLIRNIAEVVAVKMSVVYLPAKLAAK